MNHRCCQRRAVNIVASMHARNALKKSVRITNISRGGAYVETRSARRVPIDSMIELDVKLSNKHHTERASVQAMVIHRTADGFGVMFVDEYSQFIQKLCDSMLSESPPVDKSLAATLECRSDIDSPEA